MVHSSPVDLSEQSLWAWSLQFDYNGSSHSVTEMPENQDDKTRRHCLGARRLLGALNNTRNSENTLYLAVSHLARNE